MVGQDDLFGAGLLSLLGLGNGKSCSTVSQPTQFNSAMGEQGGKAQTALTLGLCWFIVSHKLAAQLLEGRLGFVTVAK